VRCPPSGGPGGGGLVEVDENRCFCTRRGCCNNGKGMVQGWVRF